MGRIIIPNFEVSGQKYELVVTGDNIPNSLPLGSNKAKEVQKLARSLFQEVVKQTEITRQGPITLRLSENKVTIVDTGGTFSEQSQISRTAIKIHQAINSPGATIIFHSNEQFPTVSLELHQPARRGRSRSKSPRKKVSTKRKSHLKPGSQSSRKSQYNRRKKR